MMPAVAGGGNDREKNKRKKKKENERWRGEEVGGCEWDVVDMREGVKVGRVGQWVGREKKRKEEAKTWKADREKRERIILRNSAMVKSNF